MLIYPKQNKEVSNDTVLPLPLYYKGETLKDVKFFCFRSDAEEPFVWIGMCIDERYPDICNRLIVSFDTMWPLSCKPAFYKPHNVDYAKSKLLNIRVGECNGNTVYKIPVNLLNKDIYVMIIEEDGHKYLKFYPDCGFELTYVPYIKKNAYEFTISSLHAVKYKMIDKRKYITRDDVYEFLLQLMGDYTIYGNESSSNFCKEITETA